jgi:hypothetical protein
MLGDHGAADTYVPGDFVLAEVIQAPENEALVATRRKFGDRF